MHRATSLSLGAKTKWIMPQKEPKANEILGDELSKLWSKAMLITRKYYSKEGWIEGELSYAPSPK